jgi:hypothetical protein
VVILHKKEGRDLKRKDKKKEKKVVPTFSP